MNIGIIPKKKIFGSAISGTVVSIGKNIQQFKIGDHVIGDLADFGFGGFAEFTATSEKALIHKPESLSFEIASSLPVAATTALQALRNKGNIKKGQKVLIVGSSGGVGTFALQLAKYFKTEVTAVCSTSNLQQSKSLGADFVIDYTKEDFTKQPKKYDLIILINGNYSLLACRRMLTNHGTCVMVGGVLSQIFKFLLFGWLLSFGSKKLCSLSAKHNQQDLEFVAKLTAEDKITPVIENYFSLNQTAKAMAYLQKGHARGKLVIKVV